VFGCWTSVSRKSVLPVFEELNSILFYPVQYEGEESSKNVFYTGAAPNQQAIPAVDYLAANEPKVQRWVLAGTDYVYPRTTNKIIEVRDLKSKGVKDEDTHDQLHAVRRSDWQNIVAQIKKFGSAARRPPSSPPSTATPTCRSTRSWPNQASRPPTSRWWPSRSARRSWQASTPSPCSATWRPGNYFRERQHAGQQDVHRRVAHLHQGPQAHHQRPMEAHYIGFNDVDQGGAEGRHHRSGQGDRRHGRRHRAEPHRRYAAMMPNHHITKPVLIGEVKADGQFNVSGRPKARSSPTSWSPYLEGSKDLIADWRSPMSCGNFNVVTGKCGGASK